MEAEAGSLNTTVRFPSRRLFVENFSQETHCFGRPDFECETTDLAYLLVGNYLVYQSLVMRITETEAYTGSDDAASHGYRGINRKNATMFGPPGHLYVYLSYGIHRCINIVAGNDGESSGILIRAVEPICVHLEFSDQMSSVGFMSLERSAVGPGRVAKAISSELSHDGADLCSDDSAIFIFSIPSAASPTISCMPRVGISKATDLPWRYIDQMSSAVTKTRPVSQGK